MRTGTSGCRALLDVIKAAGHLVSPFEVESVLMTHPAVSQAGVIGVPDPVAGSAVKAFVELKAGQVPGEALRRDILAHARRLLGVAAAPREIAFSFQLPAHPQLQDHAQAAASPRARPARGGPFHAGGHAMSKLPAGITRERGLHLLREMLRIRQFEGRCAELYGAGKIRGFLHLYDGEEAIAVGVMQVLGTG